MPLINGKFYEEGEVLENLPNNNFKVRVSSGFIKTCYLAGKIKMDFVRIFPGDRIRAEFTLNNPMRGRIISRFVN
ncbi:translation initiation factor IF-1 [Candidatus Vidania fulgoroideorum]